MARISVVSATSEPKHNTLQSGQTPIGVWSFISHQRIDGPASAIKVLTRHDDQTLNNQVSNSTMKVSTILFAFVCLGLLALALAHDGESTSAGLLPCNHC